MHQRIIAFVCDGHLLVDMPCIERSLTEALLLLIAISIALTVLAFCVAGLWVGVGLILRGLWACVSPTKLKTP